MAIVLDSYQYASDDGTSASLFSSTGTNTMAMGPRMVRGVVRSDPLPFPDTETTQPNVYQFIFIIGYTGSPIAYPDLYGTIHVRIFDSSGTIIEWDANVSNPTRATSVGFPGDDNLSSFTSVLTPTQTPIANVRVEDKSSFSGFGSSQFAAYQSIPAAKKLTAYRSTSSTGRFLFSVYSDPFSIYIPNDAQIEAQMTKSFDNTTPVQYYALALYNSQGSLMTFTRVGGTNSAPNVRGVIPADANYGPAPIVTRTTLAAGFYWQSSDETWNRVADFDTTAGAINNRTIEFDSNGVHDVYSFVLNSNGIAIFRLLQVTSSGLVIKCPFFVHPAGFQVSAIRSGSSTLIESWETFSNKTPIYTFANTSPLALYRTENGEFHFLGKTSSGSVFYVSYDEGRTWEQMAAPFDSTFETYDGCAMAGPGDMAVATKSGQLYIRISNNLSTWVTPTGFTPITLPSGFKTITLRQRYVNGLVSIIATDSATFQYETVNDGSSWTVIV